MQDPLQRFDDLTDVLRFAQRNPSKFTLGEKIMINQERARILGKMGANPTKDTRPPYKVTAKIENKIKEVLAWLKMNQNQ